MKYVKVNCSVCGCLFELPEKDYEGEKEYIEEVKKRNKRKPPGQKGREVEEMKPWYCSMKCFRREE